MTAEQAEIEALLRSEAAALGFSDVGFASATEADTFPQFADWLDAGYAGGMHYLEAKRDTRRHPEAVFAGVRTVMMLALDYGPPAASERDGKVAAYAQRPDYHELVWAKLNALRDKLTLRFPKARAKGVCDTAPLLERDFARRAGLGWFGKNAMLIHPKRGSFFFLAALLLDIDLPASEPFRANHCGTCTACLAACPTKAFAAPGVLDATKCLSYHTIELRGPIPVEFRASLGDRLFGCDDCQTACPWNRFAEANDGFPASPELAGLDPSELLALTPAEFRRRFAGAPMLRTKYAGLLRNAAIVLGNTGGLDALPALRQAAAHADEVIAEAAHWAIRQIEARTAELP